MLPRTPAASARRRLLQLASHHHPSAAAAAGLSNAAAPAHDEVIASVSPQGGVGSIVLNRPRALNALNLPMVRALDGVLRDWAADPKVSMSGCTDVCLDASVAAWMMCTQYTPHR